MSTDLCPKHNLAIAPDGKCVLCRRSPLLLQRDNESWVSNLFTWLLLLCLLATFGGLVYVASNPTGYQGGRYVDAPPVDDLDARRASQPPDASAVQATTPGPVAGEPTPTPAGPAAAATSRAAASDDGEGATPGSLRRKPVASEIPPEELTRARQKVEVIMFAAPWCYICDRSRDFLRARDVGLVEHDIELSGEAMDALTDINPAATIPTFQIGGETIVGFHPWVLEDAVHAQALEHYASRQP